MSPISADLDSLLNRFSSNLQTITGSFRIQQHDHLPSLESVLQDSIGGIIVTSKVQVPEQRIQFLFGNAKSMAKVVGVGLDFAKVYLSRENLITIEKINQLEWGQLWSEALQDGSSFYEPILIPNNDSFPSCLGPMASDASYWSMLMVFAFFFMTRSLLQLNAMAIHDCLQRGSTWLGMPSGKDKIGVKAKTSRKAEWSRGPSLNFLWDVFVGCVGKHGVGCISHHGEADEDTIGDGGSATPWTNIGGRGFAQKHDHEDMPRASMASGEGHHEGRESTSAEGKRNCGQGDTPSEGGGRNIGDEKDYHNQDHENVHEVAGKDGEGHAKSVKDPSTGIWGLGAWVSSLSQVFYSKGDEGEHGGKESTSGGSGGGDAPGERGEGGSDPNGGDDNRSSSRDGSGNPSEETHLKTVVVRVHPKYQPSDCRWEENGRNIDPDDQDLKTVNINPRLTLTFQKEGETKLLTTHMSVSFDISAAKPGHEDVNNSRFGWFQRRLSVSLNSAHGGAAQLVHEVLSGIEVTTRTDRTNTQTALGTWERRGNVSLTAAVVQGGITFGKPTESKTTVHENSMETPTEHIRRGFLALDTSNRGETCQLSYEFVYQNSPTDIKDTQGNKRSTYVNTGMCSTVCAKVEGTWDGLDENENSLYEFRAERDVCELTQVVRPKKKSLMKNLLQIYEMKLYINHKMTNIFASSLTQYYGGDLIGVSWWA
jgi:hypothetical protein